MPIYNMVRKGSYRYEPPTWAGGTDAEIVEALEKHYAGEIDLTDYWSVGDERQVSLSAMWATGVGESHVAQTVTMVLMNVGGKTLATAINGISECAFIVGQKDCLKEAGYMNSSNTNTGGWNDCARRTWCNATYRDSIPSTLRGIFKQHQNVTSSGSSTGTTTSTDYFALPAEKEVFGSVTHANSTAESSLSQFTYYAASASRIKELNGSASIWWERSPYYGNYTMFCYVFPDGSGNKSNASNTYGIAPFGVI